MKKEFKVGNKVWSKRFGYGVVVLKEDEEWVTYPIHVSFKEVTEYYTKEGVWLSGDQIELFHKRDIFPILWQKIINKLFKNNAVHN